MKIPDQMNGAIRNISKKTGVNPNSHLQMCLFEEKELWCVSTKSGYFNKVLSVANVLTE